MTNRKKIGGLLFLLAIPILILVFLEIFGQQHYSIPTDPAEAEGLSAEVPAGSLGRTFQFTTLPVNPRGNPVSDRLLTGKETIIFPVNNADSDTARTVLEKLARVQDVFEDEDNVQILAVVDTQDLSKLSSLAQQYRSQAPRWQFLANTSRANILSPVLPTGTSAATVLLVDEDQNVRGYYDGMQEDEIDRLVVETRILLYGVE